MYFNSAFSHDALNALYASGTEEKLKLSTGRFFVPILRTIFGSITLPWFVGFFSLLMISLSSYLITYLFDIHSIPSIALSAAIMVTNSSVTAMNATFMHELHIDTVALLLSCLCAYYVIEKNKVFLPIILTFLSLGIYQSFITVSVTTVVLTVILKMYDNKFNAKQSLHLLIKGALTISIGTVIYYIFNLVLCRLLKLNPDNTINTGLGIISSIVKCYKYVIRRLLCPYSIWPWFIIGCLVILILGATCLIISKHLIKNKKSFELLLSTGLLALLPIFMNSFGLVNPYVHDLMVYSIWILLVFCVRIIIENKGTQIIYTVCFIFFCIIIWNNLIISNTCYLKKNLEDKATLSVMTRVTYDLEQEDGYQLGVTPVMFIGNGPYRYYIKGFEDVHTITGVDYRGPIFGTNTWYYNGYQAYYDYFLNYPIVTISPEYFEKHVDEYKEMIPSFPQKGYICYIDGVIVVNMGN